MCVIISFIIFQEAENSELLAINNMTILTAETVKRSRNETVMRR